MPGRPYDEMLLVLLDSLERQVVDMSLLLSYTDGPEGQSLDFTQLK